MSHSMKFFFSIFLGLTVVLGQYMPAYAAPRQDEASFITGTVQSIVIEADGESEIQSVVVVILLESGERQTVRLDAGTAASLGLVTVDESGGLAVDGSKIGMSVSLDTGTVLPDELVVDEKLHPVGGRVADFFSDLLGVDYDIVMGSHADGFGFGVIAQALWLTNKMGGDVVLFQTILDAKKSGDYSMITLSDGSIPQSWGQLKKAVFGDEKGTSLGDVMSDGDDRPGNGKPENPGNGNGKPEDPGNGKGKSNLTGQDKDKTGNGKTK